MSISAERIHLAASGRAAQEKAGPKAPSPGPTLPMADMTVLMDSVSPTPAAHQQYPPYKDANQIRDKERIYRSGSLYGYTNAIYTYR